MSAPDKSPVPRDEYEARHLELQQKYETFSNRVWRVLVVIAVALAALGAAVGWQIRENNQRISDVTTIVHENRRQNKLITDSIVESCERNGNTLREAVTKFGEVQISQIVKKSVEQRALAEGGLYHTVFPNLSKTQINELVERTERLADQETAELRRALVPVKPVDCAHQFDHSK
jgi:hypothetical protein